MKKIRIKYLPALAFILCLAALFAAGVRPFLYSAYGVVLYERGIHADTFKKIEKDFDPSLPTRYFFIDVNSLVDRITGKRTKNEYVKLDNGMLAYVMEKVDTKPAADAVISLNEYMKTTVKKPLLYVQFPFHINPEDQQLPPGSEDHSDENTTEFLAYLAENGVAYYDYRPVFQSQPDYYSLFYRTDHHWTAEAGFLAAKELINELAARDASFAADGRVTDFANYRVERYDNFFGSIGRQFGRFNCGYESFSAISPKYELDLSAYDGEEKLLEAGGAEKTVLFPEKIPYENPYHCTMYGYYMNGDKDYRHIVNRTDGLKVAPKKILVIKDSYANTMTPYLAYAYQDLTVVDLRHLTVPLTEVIEKVDPDLTIVAYNPGALAEGNEVFFNFFGPPETENAE